MIRFLFFSTIAFSSSIFFWRASSSAAASSLLFMRSSVPVSRVDCSDSSFSASFSLASISSERLFLRVLKCSFEIFAELIFSRRTLISPSSFSLRRLFSESFARFSSISRSSSSIFASISACSFLMFSFSVLVFSRSVLATFIFSPTSSRDCFALSLSSRNMLTSRRFNSSFIAR